MNVSGPSGGDHPRVRGEQATRSRRSTRTPGSSPRARGAGRAGPRLQTAHGIIPACAGSSALEVLGMLHLTDHPRVRGEQQLYGVDVEDRAGSSPRARGAAAPGRPPTPGRGIIPACAGSRFVHEPVDVLGEDHPRVRGEQCPFSTEGERAWGSSPRARGAAGLGRRLPPVGGIIPACAGSSPSRSHNSRRRRDHPRVRGEQSTLPCPAAAGFGSSPRARGAGPFPSSPRSCVWIIPACAGSSRPGGLCAS